MRAIDTSPTVETVKAYTGADLQARRTAIGLLDLAVLHRLIGIPPALIARWERGAGHREQIEAAVRQIAKLERRATRIADGLLAQSFETGEIITFRSDADVAEHAGFPVASVHRAMAARAAQQNPAATVLVHGLTDAGESTRVEKSALLVRLSALGISGSAANAAIGVHYRVLQRWLAGKPDLVMFPEHLERLAEIEKAASAHRAMLAAKIGDHGAVLFAQTDADLELVAPGSRIPLVTHHTVAGELLAGDPEARAAWVSDPRRHRED